MSLPGLPYMVAQVDRRAQIAERVATHLPASPPQSRGSPVQRRGATPNSPSEIRVQIFDKWSPCVRSGPRSARLCTDRVPRPKTGRPGQRRRGLEAGADLVTVHVAAAVRLRVEQYDERSFGAGGRNRTDTSLTALRIFIPLRLSPPHLVVTGRSWSGLSLHPNLERGLRRRPSSLYTFPPRRAWLGIAI